MKAALKRAVFFVLNINDKAQLSEPNRRTFVLLQPKTINVKEED